MQEYPKIDAHPYLHEILNLSERNEVTCFFDLSCTVRMEIA